MIRFYWIKLITSFNGTVLFVFLFELDKNTISTNNNGVSSNNKELVGSNSFQTNSGDRDKQKDEESSRQLKEKYVK